VVDIVGFILGAVAITASDAPTPTRGLRLEVDRHVQELMNRTDLPRFETTIEVVGHTPQEMFERHLEGFDAMCGPGGGGSSAPTVAEMARMRPSIPLIGSLFTVDVFKTLEDIEQSGPDRFFVYRVVSPDGVHYYVREGRMPVAQLILPGAIAEPIAAFHDKKRATHAVWRFEHGFTAAEAPPPPPCKN
jgi:hypothetical protein